MGPVYYEDAQEYLFLCQTARRCTQEQVRRFGWRDRMSANHRNKLSSEQWALRILFLRQLCMKRTS